MHHLLRSNSVRPRVSFDINCSPSALSRRHCKVARAILAVPSAWQLVSTLRQFQHPPRRWSLVLCHGKFACVSTGNLRAAVSTQAPAHSLLSAYRNWFRRAPRTAALQSAPSRTRPHDSPRWAFTTARRVKPAASLTRSCRPPLLLLARPPPRFIFRLPRLDHTRPPCGTAATLRRPEYILDSNHRSPQPFPPQFQLPSTTRSPRQDATPPNRSIIPEGIRAASNTTAAHSTRPKF